MTKKESYEKRTEDLLKPLVDEQGFELVDVEYVREAGNWYLRAYIDKPGGIAVDDCEMISRALSDLLDQEDYIEQSYILEVSSPGLGRPLKKMKDFARSIGKDVEVRTYRAIEGRKEFTGILKSYSEDDFTITADEKDMTFRRSETALVRLAFDF